MAAVLTPTARAQSKHDEDIVQDSLQEFSQLQTWRSLFAAQWEEVAELILPTSRNTFFYGNTNWPGQKKTDRQVDASGMVALYRFAAICDSLLTPRNLMWHGLESDYEYVMKDRASRLWFEQATKTLFKLRYNPLSNFSAQNQSSFLQLGAFGNQGMFIDEFDNTLHPYVKGIRYKSMPVGELFIRENHQGLVDGFIRWFRMSARQCLQKFGEEKFPELLRPALEQNSEMLYNFIHRVVPRTDYDPDRMDEKGKPYASYYISMEGRVLLKEGGYRMMPAAISRYEQTPNEVYGRSPAMMVLPALKTLNAEKVTFLTQGHRAAAPVLLGTDDGIMGMDMRPGAFNKGAMTADGKRLVDVLPSGNIQISEKMMAEEKSLIGDVFLTSLFQILTDHPAMTATQVIELMNEKGILLAPTMGGQMSGYLGPLVERELDIASSLGLLPPMPPRLKEAKGQYTVTYTGPLSRAMHAQEAAGFMRTVETVKELVNITQDMSLLDPFDFKTAIPAIAAIQSVPESWMSDADAQDKKAKARAQSQARQQAIQAAPAQAAMMKAQAAQAKAGMGQPAPGQMPAGGGQPLAQQLGG